MEFIGLKPLAFNAPSIEIETPAGEIIDLYNESTLRRVVLDGWGLRFAFTSDLDDARHFVVGFRDIRDLRVMQPSDWAPEEAEQIEDLLLRPEGPWQRVVFKAGGFEYEFDCAAVHFMLDDLPLG